MCGGSLDGLTLDPGGESVATLQGDFTIKQAYEIGVAGLLAEAKGLASRGAETRLLNLDKLAPLAQRIFGETSAHYDDEHYGFLVIVPLSGGIPSKETARASVSDFARPIADGLDEPPGRYRQLTSVSR
jgi:hypothetical protein